MLQNYFKIAVRNLFKHKSFSFINILGLSVGIACCALLALYIQDELAYEKQFEGAEHIYRVTSTFQAKDGQTQILQRTSPPVGMTMLAEFPELESATRVAKDLAVELHLLKQGDKSFYEKKGYVVDSTFFAVFPYEFKEGDRQTALNSPSSVILSETVANKFFGSRSALDELITINSGTNTDTFRVTGVLKTPQMKSHLDADFYMCMNSNGLGKSISSTTTWATDNFIFTYLKLRPGAKVENLLVKFPALMNKYGEEENQKMGHKKILGLQPLLDVHLYSTHFDYNIDLGTPGNITYLYITASIGFFILILACINFMNLTTAKAAQRAGEVGIRKTMGANRTHLIIQFLGESMTITLVAMILSFGLIELALPFFNELVQTNIHINSNNIAYVAGALFLISILTGFVAGSYPALFLSSFEPARVLKGKRAILGFSNPLRKSLIVFQFVVSIILVSSIIVIQKQLSYIQNKSLGFDADYKIIVPLRTVEASSHYPQFKTLVKQIAGVTNITAASSLPSMPVMSDWSFYPAGRTRTDAIGHFIINTDEDYFKTMGISVIAGRDFRIESDFLSPAQDPPRSTKVMVNRSSLKKMGIDLKEAAGTKLFATFGNTTFNYEIVGVVDDFNQFSLHQAVSPLLFYVSTNPTDFIYSTISIKAEDFENIQASIQAAWKAVIPDVPYENEFLSDSVKRQYENDKRVAGIIFSFTLIAILISCLGLYGLSIFIAELKVKEIGIRKVLGATIGSIIGLLTKDIIILVFIALVLAGPIGYYAMDKWLENFAYRVELDIAVFVASGVLAFAIAWLTMSFQSMKAALANPVESLRNE